MNRIEDILPERHRQQICLNDPYFASFSLLSRRIIDSLFTGTNRTGQVAGDDPCAILCQLVGKLPGAASGTENKFSLHPFWQLTSILQQPGSRKIMGAHAIDLGRAELMLLITEIFGIIFIWFDKARYTIDDRIFPGT